MTLSSFDEAFRVFREYYEIADICHLRPGLEAEAECAEGIILEHRPQSFVEASAILAVVIENSESLSLREGLVRVQEFLSSVK